MSILDKLFGHQDQPQRKPGEGGVDPNQPASNPSFTGPVSAGPPGAPGQLSDEQAIARYRYMLQTAPPEAIEQAHQEAFAKLTPEQRKQVLQQLSSAVPPTERPHDAVNADDPRTLARMATRAEMREPGIMERVFGGGGYGMGGGMPGMGGGGPGLGSIIAGSLIGNIAGNMVSSVIARHFFSSTDAGQAFFGGGGDPFYHPSSEHQSRDDDRDDDDDADDQDDDDDNDDDSNDDDSDDNSDDSDDGGDSGSDDDSGGSDDV